MNLDNILNYAQNMGPTFWVAVFAIALGATLLIVSMMTLIRRIGPGALAWKNPFKFGKKKRMKGRASSAENGTFAPVIRKTDSGYEAAGFVSSMNPGAKTPEDHSDIIGRLRIAAETLEEIKRCFQEDKFTPGYSTLKDDGEGVEYLFKTTAG